MVAALRAPAVPVSSPFDGVSASGRRRRNRELGFVRGIPKILLLPPSKLSPTTPRSLATVPKKKAAWRCESRSSSCYEHIPEQFREENLKEELMENFKNIPKYLYGLTTSQMDMFMTEDNPVRRQGEKVTEESISSARNYLDSGGMYSLAGMKEGPSKYSMSVSMYRGGARGYGKPRTAPPDLPSLLLDARIVYLGMPIVPAVTELLVAQLMWLDYDNPSKPIYLYINSSGTQNEKMETVGSETEAYAIADMIAYCKSKVYTVNCGMAYGQAVMLLSLGAKGYRALQPNASTKLYLPKVNKSSGAVMDMWIKAAMLLSLGAKGYRALQPNASTKLYLPKVNKSSGAVMDMWIKAKELDANTCYYVELLAKGIGKPKEEIAKDIQRPKYFQAQEAIAYGIADKIIDSRDVAYEKRNYDEMLAQSKAMRRAAGAGPQAAPSGFR